jgi:hypothetical protein
VRLDAGALLVRTRVTATVQTPSTFKFDCNSLTTDLGKSGVSIRRHRRNLSAGLLTMQVKAGLGIAPIAWSNDDRHAFCADRRQAGHRVQVVPEATAATAATLPALGA